MGMFKDFFYTQMSRRKKNSQKKAAEIKIELSFPQIIQNLIMKQNNSKG